MQKEFRKELILEGLNCASCSSKIEARVTELDHVKLAVINFVTKTLTIEIEDKRKEEYIVNSTIDIVKKLEPDVIIKDKNPANYQGARGHNHDHNHDYGNKNEKIRILKLGIALVFFVVAIAFKIPPNIKFSLYLISYVVVGGEVLLRAGRNIFRGQVFDENFLMALATMGAFIIGEFPEGVAVMLFYQIGELFQGLAVNRSRKSIAGLMDIRPDYANLKIGNEIEKVAPEEVGVGDHIIVKPGEKIALDGFVINGRSTVDTSALTGESLPREVEEGSEILAGFINVNGLLTIEVSREFGESTVSKILDLVENASNKKAPTENFITWFAGYYTPFVVLAAIGLAIIPPLFIEGAAFSQWFYRALVFLVISCPCALVISIPLAFFGGIGGASRKGILVKGGNYLEALKNAEMIVLDKTGTLTKGVFQVTEIKNDTGIAKEEILRYAAHAESFSNHPIARSILKAYGKEIDKEKIESYQEVPGHGIKARIDNKEILAGNMRLMDKENIDYSPDESVGTVVYLAIDKKFAGTIIISDEVKKDSLKAIKQLKDMGIKKTVMLTGDSRQVGIKIGEELGLDEVYTDLLPHEKVEKLETLDKMKSGKGKLVFVGDGINDAPVLARADIGVAMGGMGSDAAIEAADIVLMTDEPGKLVTAIKIAKKTNQIVWQNIAFAFGVKIIVLFLGAGGLATMWGAVFADVGVALIAVFNAMRVLNVRDI